MALTSIAIITYILLLHVSARCRKLLIAWKIKYTNIKTLKSWHSAQRRELWVVPGMIMFFTVIMPPLMPAIDVDYMAKGANNISLFSVMLGVVCGAGAVLWHHTWILVYSRERWRDAARVLKGRRNASSTRDTNPN